jgi:hypothetical protein
MRPSRIFRWIVRIFLLVFTLSLSAVSLLGGFSAVTVLDPDSYNINIPDGPPIANLDISNPSTMQIIVPFNITNVGVYDLTDIELSFQIGLNYTEIDYPTLGVNSSRIVKIFDKLVNYGNILHGKFLKANFSGVGTDFANIPALSIVDMTHPLLFHANFTFGASYSLNLYRFEINIINLPLGP